MPKDGERAYLALAGEAGRRHSLLKPFSDDQCGQQLASMGAIMSLLPPAPAPATVLDLGCGGGWTSIFLAKAGYRVTGQDLAPDMIVLAEENRQAHGLEDNPRFLCSDFESLDLDGQFDCALFFDSLHHAEDEGAAIRSAYRALKPGGILITHEPGEGHSQEPHSIEAMRAFGVSERDMPPHLIIRHGREAGFRRFRILPMPQRLFNTFYAERGPAPLLSKERWKVIRRVSRWLFQPSMTDGAIVILHK